MGSKEFTSMIRSAAYEVIKEIGKKILSGSLNLTTISMPIRVMNPISNLQQISYSFVNIPIYFQVACNQKDIVERLKWVIVAIVSSYSKTIISKKPVSFL